MKHIRLLVLTAATVGCLALTAPSAFANFAESKPFSCAPSTTSGELPDCQIAVTTEWGRHIINGFGTGSRGIWLDSTHAVHNASGYTFVSYTTPTFNRNWMWRACGWFYHANAPRHIVCSPWAYEGPRT